MIGLPPVSLGGAHESLHRSAVRSLTLIGPLTEPGLSIWNEGVDYAVLLENFLHTLYLIYSY